MITILNIETVSGKVQDVTVPSSSTQTIDGTGLTLLPALIDPHVHFRTPGAEHKENWISGAQAAIAGGVTTVFDMPNNNPSCISSARLLEKRHLVCRQLEQVAIPLRYHFYVGASSKSIDGLSRALHRAIGIKVFMGSSTGHLLMDDDDSLRRVFSLAAHHNRIVSVHAEDETAIAANMQKVVCFDDPAIHSQIRSPDVAAVAAARAIAFAEECGARLCLLHTSTRKELEFARDAKKRGVVVYVEVSPHHLFLEDGAYGHLGMRGKVNPPLRTADDRQALWEGIYDGSVDFIGSDHAPHTLDEKQRGYHQTSAGFPGIELVLPLLLDACSKGWISLKRIAALTRCNIERIFGLEEHDDVVLVDRQMEQCVDDADLKTKCGWSPYHGLVLKGWPVATTCRGKIYQLRERYVTIS